jgi:anti-sigma28 factor (negative regulator of flagellin synthesis)
VWVLDEGGEVRAIGAREMSSQEATERIQALEQRVAALETAIRDGFLMVTRQVEKSQKIKK